MKCSNVWVAGTGAALGQLKASPIADSDSADTRDMQSVSISNQFPVEFAIQAGREAISNMRSDASEIGLHIFCNMSASCLVAIEIAASMMEGRHISAKTFWSR